jgi:hypothetical protein
MSNMRKLPIVGDERIACFKKHSASKTVCNNKCCKNWINHNSSYNCAILLAKEGPKTLQEIGNLFGLSRMRIHQIEKSIHKKLKTHL